MIARGTLAPLVAALAIAGALDAVAQPLRRVIAPFVVDGPGTTIYRNPFSGGLWQPRIGLRDVSADGRPDLFALNPDGELRYYRNEGSFTFRRIVPSAYDTLPISNWFRFADLDGDGDAELLTAGPRSEVMVLDNEGTDPEPRFRVPARVLANADGDTIRTQRETVPSLVDIDADGDLDLFAGNLDGTITFYRNTGTRAVPAFAFVTARYMEIQVLGGGTAAPDATPPPGPLPDFGEGERRSVPVATCRTPSPALPRWRGRENEACTESCAHTGGAHYSPDPAHVLEPDNTVGGSFSLEATEAAGLETGTTEACTTSAHRTDHVQPCAPVPHSRGGQLQTRKAGLKQGVAAAHGASVLDFADLDGDGDLDILFGDAFTLKLLHFHNTGTATAAQFSMTSLDTAFRPTGDDVESEGFNQPVTGDLDGDGDLDAIIAVLLPSSATQPLTLYENIGTVTAPIMRRRSIDVTSEIDLGTYAAPTTIDDVMRRGLLVGSSAGRLTYFERIDEGATTRFAQSGTIPLPGLFQTVPAAGDLDGDGSAEIVVGEAFGSLIFHRFVGGVLTRYGDTFQVNRNASPTLVDMDGDGDLDLLSGAENGRFAYFENGGSPTAPAFARATPPAPFDVLDVGYDSAPRFFDLDGDGDLDAMIGGRTGGSSGARDTLRFLLRDGSGYLESSAYPPLSLARNPVPLGLRLPEGTVVLVGDLSGGIKALVDTALPSGIGVRVETGIRIALDGARVRVAWDGPAEAGVSLVDLRGRTVRAASIAGGSGAVGFEELPSGVYLFAIDVAGERRTVLISHRR